MIWFDRHIDRWLEPWAQGELSSSQAWRLLRHAHSCARCCTRYERWVWAHRALEHGDSDKPSSVELMGLEAAGVEAVLAAVAPTPARAIWPILLSLGGVAVVTCLVLMVAPAQVSEWQVRGAKNKMPIAVLRIFCAAPGQALRELGPGHACPPGGRLAFAAEAESPFSHVAVRVSGAMMEGSAGAPGIETFTAALSNRPSEENPLERTIGLQGTPGTAEIVAAFGPSSSVVLEAVQGRESEVVVVRRQVVKVDNVP